MMRYVFIPLALLAAPALAQEPVQATIENTTGAAVAARLAAGCMDRSWRIAVQTETQVECRYHDSAQAQRDALLNAFGGRNPRASYEGVVRFAIVALDGTVRVQATDAVIGTTAFGNTVRLGTQGDAMRQVLAAAGKQAEIAP